SSRPSIRAPRGRLSPSAAARRTPPAARSTPAPNRSDRPSGQARTASPLHPGHRGSHGSWRTPVEASQHGASRSNSTRDRVEPAPPRKPFGSAEYIEQVDCLVRRIPRQRGLQSDTLDEIVTLVDERLAKNRTAGAGERH